MENTPQGLAPDLEQEKAQNPLDQPIKQDPESELVQSILASKEADEGQLLESAPKLDESLLDGSLEEERDLGLMAIKAFFWLLTFLGVGSFLFFSSQLRSWYPFVNAELGVPNYTEQLATSNQNLINEKTETNFYNYLMAKGALDSFSYYGDSFRQNFMISKAQTGSAADKVRAEGVMENLKPVLAEDFARARTLLAQPMTVPLIGADSMQVIDSDATKEIFREALNVKLVDQANKLLNQNGETDRQTDYKHFMNTAGLVYNDQLMAILAGTDFAALSNEEVANLVKDVNAAVVNDISVIQQIKEKRIVWSDVINEIDQRTKAADEFYASGLFENLGGVRYTSYDFDSEARRVSLSGQIKTVDSKNFSKIIDLIDSLNASEMFNGVAMRSFSKSGSLEEGYSASIRFTLDLVDPNAPEVPEVSNDFEDYQEF